MPNYLMLGHFTDKGINSIDEYNERIKKFKDLCQSEGAKLIHFYVLMGQYDVMSIIDAPSPDIIATIALKTGQRGMVRTETMNAFTEKEVNQLISNLS